MYHIIPLGNRHRFLCTVHSRYRRIVGGRFFFLTSIFFFSPQDCNKDGVTDCDDYARIHFNGREDCSAIDNTNFWRRYVTCRPVNSRGESTGISRILYYILSVYYYRTAALRVRIEGRRYGVAGRSVTDIHTLL